MVNHSRAGTAIETGALANGYKFIAGVDEVGRGCLAGPVVAAAVVLPSWIFESRTVLASVRDSKLVPESERIDLHQEIISHAIAIGIAGISNIEIDLIGIAPATRQAMMAAIGTLPVAPDIVLIDFVRLPELAIAQLNIVDGDALSLSIAAASIVAKTARDALMRSFHDLHPNYGFDRNKGYGTQFHLQALSNFGPCVLHRQTFAPLRHRGLL